jgi:hypothetical protein
VDLGSASGSFRAPPASGDTFRFGWIASFMLRRTSRFEFVTYGSDETSCSFLSARSIFAR